MIAAGRGDGRGDDDDAKSENQSDEEDEEEEEEGITQIKQSHPSLTPTPADEDSPGGVEELTSTTNYHSQEQDTGPALALVKSQEEEEDEDIDLASLHPDYHPEQEYFSDPDFHDERPGKKNFKELLGEQKLRRERLLKSGEEVIPVASTSHFKEEEIGEESESETTIRSLHGVTEEPDEQQLVEELESGSDQVTASEARADLFVDESTLVDSNVCSKQDTRKESNYDEDVTTPKVVEIDVAVEVKVEKTDSLDDAKSEDLDESSKSGSPQELEPLEEDTREKEETFDKDFKEQVELEEESLVDLENESQVEIEKVEEEEEAQKVQKEEKEVEVVKENFEKQRLSALISEYCDRLVETIKEEAFGQVELLATSSEQVAHLKVSQVFQVDFARVSTTNNEEDKMLTSNKKIYTSSMYYNDQRGSYPTIEQQVEQCRSIARQLEANEEEENDKPTMVTSSHQEDLDHKINSNRDRQMAQRRASWMFKRRRERMRSFTVEEAADGELSDRKSRRSSLDPSILTGQVKFQDSSAAKEKQIKRSKSEEEEEEEAVVTDTEYEAPRIRRRALPARATTTPMRELRMGQRPLEVARVQQLQQQSKPPTPTPNSAPAAAAARFKPFLDWRTMKDIERLKQWLPYGDFNEHNSVSPEICRKLVQDLGSSVSKEEFKVSNKKESSNKGAKLFERRQLQSSDWIVTNGSPPVPELMVTEAPASINESTEINEDEGRLMVASSNQRSRPSITEETCMVADEAQSEQVVVELKPVLSDHAEMRPPLELATVTKTASFSASSRLIIECDSPDLLTSHDDDTDDIDDDASDDESEHEEHDKGEMTPAIMVQPRGPVEESQLKEEVAVVAVRTRPQSRTGELHQASLVEWRPRVMTPTWLEAPSQLQPSEPVLWRPSGVLHLRNAHQIRIDEEARAKSSCWAIQRRQRLVGHRLQPLWAPPPPSRQQRAASLLSERWPREQHQRHSSPALSLDLNLNMNLDLNSNSNSNSNSNLNQFEADFRGGDGESDLRHRSFHSERGHAPAVAKAFYGTRNLVNEQYRRLEQQQHRRLHQRQHRTWTEEEEEDDDDDLGLEDLKRGYCDPENFGHNRCRRARHLSPAVGGTGGYRAEVPTGNDGFNQHEDCNQDYYPTAVSASDNWRRPATTTCRGSRQRPPTTMLDAGSLPAMAAEAPSESVANWRVCVGLTRRRRAHKSRLEPIRPRPQVSFALCLEPLETH